MSNSPLYGYQVQPGFDLLFSYGFSLNALIKEAQDHRLEIALEDEYHDLDLPPTTIYEFVLEEVTPDRLVAVLNEPLTLDQVLIGER